MTYGLARSAIQFRYAASSKKGTDFSNQPERKTYAINSLSNSGTFQLANAGSLEQFARRAQFALRSSVPVEHKSPGPFQRLVAGARSLSKHRQRRGCYRAARNAERGHRNLAS